MLPGVSGSGVRTGGAAGRVAVGIGELEAVGTQRAPVGIGWPAAGTGRATVAAAGTGEAAELGGAAAAAEVVAVAGVEVVGLKLMAGPSEWGLGKRPAGRGEAVELDKDKGWGFPPGNSAFQVAGQSSGSVLPRNNAHQTRSLEKKKQNRERELERGGVGSGKTPAPDTRRQAGGGPSNIPSLILPSAFRGLFKW